MPLRIENMIFKQDLVGSTDVQGVLVEPHLCMLMEYYWTTLVVWVFRNGKHSLAALLNNEMFNKMPERFMRMLIHK
jgi:hypothetical protein